MRRLAYWTAVVVALGALGGGGWVAWSAYRDTAGPQTAVRDYFAALARSDAPAALALGDVPAGPHDLLTSAVLAQQQHLAPLHDVQILKTETSGNTANVEVSYRLRFPHDDQEFTSTLALTKHSDGWRLDATAVSLTITATQATDRFTFAGTTLPSGATLLFPGALPIHFDTGNLQVDRATAAAQFAGSDILAVTVEPSASARRTLTSRITAAVQDCLRGKGNRATCPQPSVRVVPGSIDGRIAGDPAADLTFSVGTEAGGVIDVTGRMAVQGSYQVLGYDNLPSLKRGRITLPISVQADAVGGLAVQFTDAS